MHTGQLFALQVGVLATHEPPEHTGVVPEQLWHSTPPLPHVAVDWPPTQLPSLQQPPQLDVEHAGAASGAASCTPPPPPASGVVEVTSGVSPPSTSAPPSRSSPEPSSVVKPSSPVSSV